MSERRKPLDKPLLLMIFGVFLFVIALLVAVVEPLSRGKSPSPCPPCSAGSAACTSEGTWCIQDGRLFDCKTGSGGVLICTPIVFRWKP